MDMGITAHVSFWRRLASPSGFPSVSHNFVMEWAAILRNLVLGLLIAGMAGAWTSDSFSHPVEPGEAGPSARHSSGAAPIPRRCWL